MRGMYTWPACCTTAKEDQQTSDCQIRGPPLIEVLMHQVGCQNFEASFSPIAWSETTVACAWARLHGAQRGCPFIRAEAP